MRLIDADAATAKQLEQKEYWMSRGHGDGGANIVIAALEQAPTVPAKVDFHCRNCKQWHSKLGEYGDCYQWKIGCDGENAETSSDDYCSYGERREDGKT